MMSMPPFVRQGSMPDSLAAAIASTPNIFGIDGPVMSASRIPHWRPFFCIAEASSEVTSDLPTPPLPLTTPTTFLTSLRAFAATRKSGFSASEHFCWQFPQSCEQFSCAIKRISFY